MTVPTIGARHYARSIHWNDEVDRFITRHAREGFSASEISKQLSYAPHNVCVIRNAVIGRLTRLKFKNPNTSGFRKGNQEGKFKPKSKIRDRKLTIPTLAPFPNMPDETPSTAHMSLMHAKETHCRYVIGESRNALICGLPTEPGSSYCRNHVLRCLAKVKPDATNNFGGIE